MKRRSIGSTPQPADQDEDNSLDLESLLHPAQAFAHPFDVVNDADLTLSEKRAILAAWASDACAVEAVPALRRAPAGRAVRFDDIMDALRALDRLAASYRHRRRYRRMLDERIPGVIRRKEVRRRTSGDQGPALN